MARAEDDLVERIANALQLQVKRRRFFARTKGEGRYRGVRVELLAEDQVGRPVGGTSVLRDGPRTLSSMVRARTFHAPLSSSDLEITVDRGERRIDNAGRVIEHDGPKPTVRTTEAGPTLRCVGDPDDIDRLLDVATTETIGAFFDVCRNAVIREDHIELMIGGDRSQVSSGANAATLVRNMATMSERLSERTAL